MIRRRPRSKLLPYPALFRSVILLPAAIFLHHHEASAFHPLVGRKAASANRALTPAPNSVAATQLATVDDPRSEEHTSELQSRQYFVCRLLLETNSKVYSTPF